MGKRMPMAQSWMASRSMSISSTVKRHRFSNDPPYSSVRLLWNG